ncbi:MCE family protein [Mycobacterium sp. 48b]|uniref:MCE family protein n=1 Tax=Mycobacterium sp. 48b TaxID=3400426 RepID=UPI003AAFEE6F
MNDSGPARARRPDARILAGSVTVAVIVAVVASVVVMFRGGLATTVPLTVISARAGLVMNPDAKVKLLGVEIGHVESIENQPGGNALLRLAIDSRQFAQIPANAKVEISSATVFGAKSVELIPPADPSPEKMQAGQVLDSDRVTVEFNTVFENLTAVLRKVDPAKMNETLRAIAEAINGRGARFGTAMRDLDAMLAGMEPSLPTLSHEMETAPTVLNAYADAAPDLLNIADNAASMSQTVVDQQRDLDAFLVSTIGLADVGQDVVSTNRQSTTDLVHILVPTTSLTDRYNQALTCGLAGMVHMSQGPPFPEPGLVLSIGFLLGRERYRFPSNLPKVAATGGPQCHDLPNLPFGTRAPFVVADVGANPWQYGNQGILLNSDGLKQVLFGPIDGPPRNTAQIGQPG